MPVSSSRLAYDDCFLLYEKALEDPVGARFQVASGDLGQTRYFITRMHQARAIDRKDNKAIFPDPGAPLHGRSIYDPLTVQLKQDTEGLWWVYVSKTTIAPDQIESLSAQVGDIP